MSKTSPLNKEWLVALMAASLTACGGGGGSDNNPPPSGSQPPPSQPAPPPPAPPPPPPASSAPPLASAVTDVSAAARVGTFHWDNGNTAAGATGQPMDGMECSLNLPDGYDVHTYVAVYLNGEQLAMPSNVGVVPSTPSRCFYPIHTDDPSGKVHVKWSANDGYTLGELFRIWGQPLSNTDVAGLTGNPVEVFVVDNGAVTEVESDWGNIELTSKKVIHIVVGTPPAELKNFTWTGN